MRITNEDDNSSASGDERTTKATLWGTKAKSKKLRGTTRGKKEGGGRGATMGTRRRRRRRRVARAARAGSIVIEGTYDVTRHGDGSFLWQPG